MPEEYEAKEASWNSAVETARRLSYWIQTANGYYFDGDALKYFRCLINVYKEIDAKLDEKEREDVEKQYEKLVPSKEKHEQIVNDFQNSYEEEGKTINSSFPSLLHKFDLTLRRYADKHDLLNPDKKTYFE